MRETLQQVGLFSAQKRGFVVIFTRANSPMCDPARSVILVSSAYLDKWDLLGHDLADCTPKRTLFGEHE
jgi:hypothetical protein